MTGKREREAKLELWNAIDARRDELIGIVSDLVRFPSVLGEETGVQHYIAEHLSASGFATESWELDASILRQPNAGNSGVPFEGRPNVTGKLAGGSTGRSLILNGHVDVVSPEPVSQWSYDPWGAEIVEDRMYGRGAFDMKSGVALNLFLARLLPQLSISLAADLTIHSVIEEECTGNGALAASLRDRADAAIVTEPHFHTYTAAHIGVLWFRVRIEGRSAHAGHAWQGVNAIVKSVPVIQALEALDAELNTRIHPVWEGVEHPINLNMGVIAGGDWPSTVPGACELHCRVGFFPDTTVKQMRDRIELALRNAAAGDSWLAEHPPTVTYDGFQTNGVILPPGEPMIEILTTAHREVTGEVLRPQVATAVNDMRYYLFQGVPATCYGAAGGNAHASDEWLDLSTMTPAAKTLAAVIVEWCGVQD